DFYLQGKDLNRLLGRLLSWARILLLTKASGTKNFVQKECAEEYLDRLMAAYTAWSIEDCDRLFEVLWTGVDRMKKSELPRIALEATLIRAARIQLTQDLSEILRQLENQAVAPAHSNQPARTFAPQAYTPSTPPTSTSPSAAFAK